MDKTVLNRLFGAHRKELKEEIKRVLPILFDNYHSQSDLSPTLLGHLENYALRGKLIRGCLVPFVYERLPGREVSSRDLYSLAAAIELFQCMLLIHDDIMDRDELRRGEAAIHSIYSMEGKRDGLKDFKHYGESMGICFGDVVSFTAFGIISRVDCDPHIIMEILRLISEELVLVGLAQMQDVRNGALPPDRLSIDDIMSTYRCKTGRYTFSLPITIGALIRGVDADLRRKLELLGEYLGIIFQIKDDELELFSDPDLTGKANDSDIAEGKKTIFSQCLMDSLGSTEKHTLTRILENYHGAEDLHWVHQQLKKHGIREKISALVREYEESCVEIIDTIQPEALRNGLKELLDYNLGRSR